MIEQASEFIESCGACTTIDHACHQRQGCSGQPEGYRQQYRPLKSQVVQTEQAHHNNTGMADHCEGNQTT